jgi:hypothetical protein
VRIQSGKKGISKTIQLSIGPLALSAFGDPRPLGCECDHKNGDKTDCRLSNLRWIPRGVKGAILANLSPKRKEFGRRNQFAVGNCPVDRLLNDEQARTIREAYHAGNSPKGLAEHYGVGIDVIWSLLRGRTYKNSGGPIGARLREDGGSIGRGALHRFARLDDEDIAEIRSLRAKRINAKIIAAQFGISQNYVYCIAGGRTWKHLAPTSQTPS